MSKLQLQNFKVKKWQSQQVYENEDLLAIEIPLKIILLYFEHDQVNEMVFTTTMRSPGDDESLAVGLLYAEGVINAFNDVEHIRYCIKDETNNTIKVTLKKNSKVQENQLKRNLLSSSSCGVCGKEMIDHLSNCFTKPKISKPVKISTVVNLPKKLQDQQLLFKYSGGIHACALFTSSGSLITLKEDIGRHNALDKVIGNQLIKGESFKDSIIVLSGRVGFEMSQKSARAGIPVIVAIGAPTNLAVEIAMNAKICLMGFVKNNHANCYSNPEYVDFEK